MSQLATLTNKLATKLDMGDGSDLIDTLKATAFKGQVSDSQMVALRVLAKHVEVAENGCWNWIHSLQRGYGQLTHKGISQRAHRFSFENLVEKIKPGNWVLHHCDNRLCVNPNHLYQGTAIDNRADMLNRKRWSHPWGRRSTCAKGHKYEEVGFRVDKNDGSRVCRECQRNYKREQRAALKGV